MTQYFEPIPYSLWHADKAAFAAALGRSFRETGFAVITGHPIAQKTIDDNLATTKAFFALPGEAKEKYHDAPGGRQRGYTPFGTENAKGERLVTSENRLDGAIDSAQIRQQVRDVFKL